MWAIKEEFLVVSTRSSADWKRAEYEVRSLLGRRQVPKRTALNRNGSYLFLQNGDQSILGSLLLQISRLRVPS